MELRHMPAQGSAMRLLYQASSGDAWFLIKDGAGDVAVEHRPNAPSGGQPSRIGLLDFLAAGSGKPEQRALMRLIGTLVESAPAGPEMA